ncbi:MAG TPA: hypothetical protein VFG30_00195 [Polyangiales bacterium]|nr:hypothetical protein [Polyangiales bacterium]
MGRTTVLAFAVLLVAWSARASDLALEWTAPRGCPTQDALREGLNARLGREIAVSSEAPVELRGTVVALGSGYALDVRTRSTAGSERRELRARSCTELARASILMAALLLMEGTGSAPPDRANGNLRTRVPASSATRWGVFARTWVRGDLGSMPAAALGPGLAIGLAIADTRLELGGTYLPAQQMHFAGSDENFGSVQLMAAHAGVCQVLIRTPELGPCLRAEVGQLRARGEHLANNATRTGAWFLGAVGARLSFELWRGLSWQSEIAAGLPFQRIRIAVRDLDAVHRTPAVVGRFETGLLLSF